jgi:hypothetical protein
MLERMEGFVKDEFSQLSAMPTENDLEFRQSLTRVLRDLGHNV